MWFRSGRKSKRASRRVPPSFIGAGLKIEGDLSSAGAVDVAGSVTGNVTVETLTLYAGGALSGTARAETATVNGALSGRLAAADVTLGSAAHVTADITYVSLRIEAGAVFVGQSRRVESLDALPADLTRLPPPAASEPRVLDHARGPKLA
jgi:cytoskeletal protein CcmA (bactofilin family)